MSLYALYMFFDFLIPSPLFPSFFLWGSRVRAECASSTKNVRDPFARGVELLLEHDRSPFCRLRVHCNGPLPVVGLPPSLLLHTSLSLSLPLPGMGVP